MTDTNPEMTEADWEKLRNLQWSDIQDENGIDLTLIDYMLSLTPTQRLKALEQLMAFDDVLTEARVKFYGFDPRADLEAEQGGR
ncbi:MAG: hypothetical protein QOE14_1175 [Humisphaera sp.]|nr:hypothetical protein [Humisphaera sp.]